jgi:predicted permease
MLQDLRFALRTFAKTPGFTALAVLVLAIGIGANTAMFSIVNAVMFKPLSGRAGELVGVFGRDRTKPDDYRAFSYPNYVDLREQSADVFDGLMAHMFSMVGESIGDATRRTFVSVSSSNYFDTLDVRLAAGRTFTAEEERPGARQPVVIVGYDRWRDAGFNPSFIGSRIRINAIDFTVVGVAPEGFTGTMALVAPEMWLPLGMFDVVVNDIFKNRGTGLADRNNHALILAGRLKPDLAESTATERLDVVARRLEAAYPGENKNQTLLVNKLPRMSTSTSPQTDGGTAAGSAMLMALTGVVLLIACLNIANMLLARGSVRRKEIAIRLAVGGARRRVVRQLLTEALLLALAGSAAGLVLAFWSTRFIFSTLAPILPLTITFEPSPDVNVLLAATALAIVATLLFGVGPALRSSRVDIVDDLKGSMAALAQPVARFRLSARSVLVVGQIALSLTLLCVGGLFARAALAAAAADPGFRYERLLLTSIDPSMAGYDATRGRESHRAVLERLRAIPGVDAVSTTSTVPFGEFHEGRAVEAVGGAPQQTAGRRSPTYRIVGSDYFRALGLTMLRGREFNRVEEASTNAPRVAIVDELLARSLVPDGDPIGQLVRIVDRDAEAATGNDGEPMEIIGIAPPIRDSLFDRSPVPHIYVPAGRNYRPNVSVHVRLRDGGAAAENAALAAVRQEIAAVDSRLPILDLMPMRRFHDRSLELWAARAGGNVVITLGGLALLLALAGVYGVKSYVVSQRTREFGIRVAVGARPQDVMWLVLRDGMRLTAIGLAIGVPLAALAGVSLSRMLYEVSPLDPFVFTVAPLALALSATVAAWIPARRATRVAPVTALRTE